MKKFIICAAAVLFVTGVMNAQAIQKQPARPITASHTTTSASTTSVHKINSGSTTAKPVGPAVNSQKAATNTGIKRKHPRKKKKSLPKTENK